MKVMLIDKTKQTFHNTRTIVSEKRQTHENIENVTNHSTYYLTNKSKYR